MAPQKDVFNAVIDHFSDEQEEIRAAAAFAAGGYYDLTAIIDTDAMVQETSQSEIFISSFLSSSIWWRVIPRNVSLLFMLQRRYVTSY